MELKYTIQDQLDVLRRICDRGLSYGYKIQDTIVVDSFQHLKDEVERVKKNIERVVNVI